MRSTIGTSIRRGALVALLAAGWAGCGGDDAKPKEGTASNLVPPTMFMAAVLNQPAVHLTWKDTATEHHYVIQRKDGAGEFKDHVPVKDINADAHHDDMNIVKGTTYTYRIASGGPNGEKSPWSAEASATIPQ